eukprot:gene1751-3382_t
MLIRVASKSILRASGAQPIRLAFNIEVKEIIGPNLKELNSNSLVSVSFERGSKASSSKEVLVQPVKDKPELWRADFNDTLSVVTTLFRDSSGVFQDKKAKLVVRYRKKTLLGGDAFESIGEASIKLHTIACTLGEPYQGGVIGLPLTKCSMEGATLYVRITATAVGETTMVDETMSLTSGLPDDRSPPTSPPSSPTRTVRKSPPSYSMSLRTESDDSSVDSTGVSTRMKALLLEMEAMRMDVLDANKRA